MITYIFLLETPPDDRQGDPGGADGATRHRVLLLGRAPQQGVEARL